MKAISEDLRKRILDTIQRGDGSLRQIARRFLVSVSFITRLLQLHRSTGSLEPRPHGGGNPAVLNPEDLEQLPELVQKQPDATLEELRQPLGVSCIPMTCGLRLSGVTAPLAFRGATNTDIFETYVQEVLVPELKPGDVVIWDNLKPHKSEEAIEAIEAAGARVEPLPPWSPDLTPIEEMVSKVKGAMRSAAARTTNAVYWAFASALDQVTIDDIAGWFQSRAAYAMRL